MEETRCPKGLASRRGTAMLLLTAGDEQISSALASGIMAVRLPAAKPLTHEEAQVVSAEMDRQKIVDWQEVAHQMRVAMHREPVDYAGLAYDAEVSYGESLYETGTLARKVGRKLLIGYAMVVMAFHELLEALGM